MNMPELSRHDRPTSTRFLIGLLLAALAALLLVSAGASSASADTTTPTDTTSAYPPTGGCAFDVGGSKLTDGNFKFGPGSTFTIVGSGFSPNQLVTFTLDSGSIGLGTATTGADGTVTATLTVPSNARIGVGLHSVTAASGTDRCALSRFEFPGEGPNGGTDPVPPTSSSSGGGGLAFTGFAAITFVTVGGLILLAGLGFLFIGRGRRTS